MNFYDDWMFQSIFPTTLSFNFWLQNTHTFVINISHELSCCVCGFHHRHWHNWHHQHTYFHWWSFCATHPLPHGLLNAKLRTFSNKLNGVIGCSKPARSYFTQFYDDSPVFCLFYFLPRIRVCCQSVVIEHLNCVTACRRRIAFDISAYHIHFTSHSTEHYLL